MVPAVAWHEVDIDPPANRRRVAGHHVERRHMPGILQADDDLLAGTLTAARTMAERYLNRALLTRRLLFASSRFGPQLSPSQKRWMRVIASINSALEFA